LESLISAHSDRHDKYCCARWFEGNDTVFAVTQTCVGEENCSQNDTPFFGSMERWFRRWGGRGAALPALQAA
jgi:hypothetical protein